MVLSLSTRLTTTDTRADDQKLTIRKPPPACECNSGTVQNRHLYRLHMVSSLELSI